MEETHNRKEVEVDGEGVGLSDVSAATSPDRGLPAPGSEGRR